jgi:hypothetical protein
MNLTPFRPLNKKMNLTPFRPPLAQIQDSKQHGLNGLYVLLAGDLTSASQIQKVRNFISRVSKMKDKYVQVLPPERLWTLLFGEEDEA